MASPEGTDVLRWLCGPGQVSTNNKAENAGQIKSLILLPQSH